MSDYISREDAINIIKDRHCEICEHNDHRTNNWHCRNCTYAESAEDIESVPSADVQPVKHGKWIDMGDFISCSSCNATTLKEFESYYGKATRLDARTNYCPSCGARMEG